jgi:hypothetical protein
MSGGSYNYICYADIEGLLQNEDQIESMAEQLSLLGHREAAKETLEIFNDLVESRNRIEAKKERLESVWRAVEWWASGDSGQEGVNKALAQYRGEEQDDEQ